MANDNVIYSQFSWVNMGHKEQLSLMDEYYGNNSLYEATRLLKYYLGVWNEDIRPLRTPVHRSVEFFVAKIAVGEPVVSANSQAVADAAKQIMEWSNFQIQKPVHVREMSKYGDLFRKVVSENGKVWQEVVGASVVTDFKEDARGFLTEIRLDIPVEDDNMQKIRTEFWTVNDTLPYMAIWEHNLNENTPLEQLGDPIFYSPLYKFGIDFVPFVRTPFQSDGSGWGRNCVEHALIKVDEANRQATRLHQILFRYNKPTWTVSANQVMPDGTPMPPPRFKQGTNTEKTDLEVRDNTILELPGVSKIDSLIPDIKYADALAILQSQEKELEKDLPELLYYSLPEGANLSGKAIRTLLGAAVDRATQAQSNYVEGTVRANQMAITIGQFQGIFPSSLGTFDGGQLVHSIKFGDPFPMDVQEIGQALQALTSGGLPFKLALKKLNFSEEEINEAVAEKEREEAKRNEDLANSMLSFNRG